MRRRHGEVDEKWVVTVFLNFLQYLAAELIQYVLMDETGGGGRTIDFSAVITPVTGGKPFLFIKICGFGVLSDEVLPPTKWGFPVENTGPF